MHFEKLLRLALEPLELYTASTYWKREVVNERIGSFMELGRRVSRPKIGCGAKALSANTTPLKLPYSNVREFLM